MSYVIHYGFSYQNQPSDGAHSKHHKTNSGKVNTMEEPPISPDVNHDNEDSNKENSPQPEDALSCAAGVKKKVASFHEGECYELLHMEIVDRNSAHVPPRGEKCKQ